MELAALAPDVILLWRLGLITLRIEEVRSWTTEVDEPTRTRRPRPNPCQGGPNAFLRPGLPDSARFLGGA